MRIKKLQNTSVHVSITQGPEKAALVEFFANVCSTFVNIVVFLCSV